MLRCAHNLVMLSGVIMSVSHSKIKQGLSVSDVTIEINDSNDNKKHVSSPVYTVDKQEREHMRQQQKIFIRKQLQSEGLKGAELEAEVSKRVPELDELNESSEIDEQESRARIRQQIDADKGTHMIAAQQAIQKLEAAVDALIYDEYDSVIRARKPKF